MSELLFLSIGSSCACLITSYVLLDRLKWKSSLPIFLLVMVINSMVIGLLGIYSYPYVKIGVLIIDGVILGLSLGQYRGKQLLEFVCFCMLVGFCEFVSYPILLYLQTVINNFQGMNMQISMVLMISAQTVVLYVYQLYKHIIKTDKEKMPLFVSVFQVLVLPLFTIINLIFMMMIASYYLFPVILIFMLLNTIFVISLNVYLFFLFDKMEENHQLREKAVLLEEMSKMQYTYYHQLEEKYQSSRSVIHDVKRHLQVLENNELPKNSVNDYILDMKEMLNSYAQEVYSSHPIINVILHEKLSEARREHIQVDCRIAPVNFGFLREIDATVIFANLLDNAIDACKEVETGRFLQIQIEQVHDFLVILIRNSSAGKKVVVKTSKAGHAGLGLQNVRQTLEHYGGYMQVESQDHVFHIHLHIPMI